MITSNSKRQTKRIATFRDNVLRKANAKDEANGFISKSAIITGKDVAFDIEKIKGYIRALFNLMALKSTSAHQKALFLDEIQFMQNSLKQG